jgi:mannose-6-phosphate isomerase-like protein (cupin superfamily)
MNGYTFPAWCSTVHSIDDTSQFRPCGDGIKLDLNRRDAAMRHIRDTDQEIEVWRDGVRTRMFVSSVTGSSQLTIFEQWCDPLCGAPAHVHAVEEVLRVLSGSARISVGDSSTLVAAGESVIVPAGAAHGFVNATAETLHTLAILAAPIFEVRYLENERDDRRWSPPGNTASA